MQKVVLAKRCSSMSRIVTVPLGQEQLITSCPQEPVNSRRFYAYLTGVAEEVKHAYRVPLVLIVDNASIHRSKQMSSWRKLLAK